MADCIASQVEALLAFFDVPKMKIIGVSIDGGTNMVAAVQHLLGEGKNLSLIHI